MSDAPATVITDRPEAEGTIEIRTLPWWAMILIRVARTYVQGLIGFLAVGLVGDSTVREFGPVLLHAASLAVAPAVIALLMNAAEVLSKLDQTQPQLRA
jgi:hypothetical protein